ncbi:hypothetical protein E3O25_14000 [Cryobacterium sp. TMT1-3]|uniref:Uncharacterized protein n=1 Tax=Cryobacterium luteum TaxID=1424661 RepID=A0A1H8JCR2_9MICO|nr:MULTISPECIES: hypothetical protein [Cryobacterium]TFB92331.1 hypothetical protein E3O10_04625 [Cryobacterium luteum]TFC25114.1 hypothetical protein E3O25_14000 [Cryobacterium sp. TMT1-3]SEN78584.1 hypothetical protein SAMN05216281_11442 [Cryobacterium luteum]
MKLTAPTFTPPRRTFATLGALVLLAALSGCATTATGAGAGSSASATTAASPADCTGVTVVVDFGTLDADTVTDCVAATEAIAASESLATIGVTTEGSVEYGDQIVCRVNDRPAADETVVVEGQESFTETCSSMPPAYAYWALWVKASPDADWDYAMEGLGTLEVEPGQSVGLVYTTGTETPTPGS